MLAKTILIFIISFLALFFLARFQIYAPLSINSEEQIFRIESGDGLSRIASNLESQGFIRGDIFFNIYVYLEGEESALKAGDYLLSSSMSIKEIADKIIGGEAEGLKITIIEGWDIKDIAEYLLGLNICSEEEFLRVAEGNEGYLFPDTYRITSTASPSDLVGMMRDNFDKKLTSDLRAEIEKQGKTVFEIITMASIIEKEVITLEDKKLVSGILWKRIKIGMPLQSCATIAYITRKNSTKISVEETQIDSPYNTYKYTGLPIGPICNPSLDSIIAAIYPEDSNYLYYLSTPERETIFSRTFEEHNIAKAKYLK